MRRNFVFSLLVIAGAAHAQYANLDGEFVSPTTSLRTLVLDSETGVIAASVSVAINSCSGWVSGIGKISGDTLQVKPYVKEEGSENCVLTAKFNKSRNKATITEENCSAYHGAACAWEGQTVIKKR
jgi:hypothetical protein